MELGTIASALTPLALLACPVGMGVMMWMMGRGKKREAAESARPAQPASVELLREEQRRLGDEIDRLETGTGVPARAGGEPR